jgi:hypothetical protein
MHTHSVPRLLLVGLILALITTGVGIAPTAAKSPGVRTWSSTQSRENVFVQACGGSAITTNYTTTRLYLQYGDSLTKPISEYQHVSFTGVVGNAATGKSYAYHGHYTRATDFDPHSFAIYDLLLRFEVGTPGMFSVSFDHIGFDLMDNPAAVVQKIVPNVLQMDLCYLFGGSATGNSSLLFGSEI